MSAKLKRRDFITLLGGAVAWPLAARAQQPDRMRLVILLLPLGEDDPEAQSRIRAFRLGLRDADWVEGRNTRIEYRFSAIDPNRLKSHVAELATLAPDVIVGNSTPVLAALRQATTTIPIVFVVVNDPVGQASSQAWRAQEAILQGSRFLSSRSSVNGLGC